MADGFLETHFDEYQQKKAAWLNRKKYASLLLQRLKAKEKSSQPTDES
ncbi:MAG: dehydrogenase [Paludibacteraceae bacterium]|nr:dehydrogenase [Paludibacteraceae bacterium]